jgi:hypothetical protein
MPTTSWDITTVFKMGPTIVMGLQQLRVQRLNLPAKSALPRVNKVRDEATQRVVSSWHVGPQLRGPNILKLCI